MTLPGFVLHYLRIKWSGPGVARQVDVSLDPIELELDGEGIYHAETEVFRDFAPWVGLHFTGPNADVRPSTIAGDGTRQQWLEIIDGRQRSWWVSGSGWDPERNAHLSEMYRSLGRFEVAVGKTRLHLTNVALDLGRAEAEDYLAEFRDDLIMLALGRGTATGQVIQSGSTDLVQALTSFAIASRRVLDRPAVDLVATELVQPVGKLRPNAQTFREILRRPGGLKYSGRGAVERADVADNRFVHYMVQHCARLAEQIGRSAASQSQHLASRQEQAESQASHLEIADTEQISPDVFDRQLADIRAAFDGVNGWVEEAPVIDGDLSRVRLRIERPYTPRVHTHFYKRMETDPGLDERLGITSSVVEMPERVHQVVSKAKKYMRPNDEITFFGIARAERKGAKMRLLQLKRVHGMELHSGVLNEKLEQRWRYERDGWIRSLTKKDRLERRMEAQSLRHRAAEFAQRARLATEASSITSSVAADLTSQSLDWISKGVGRQFETPTGLRFVHSPPYVAALAAFKGVFAVSSLLGIDGKVLERLDRVTILHASALYERWCLIKLVAVLMEEFRFTPQPDWLARVVEYGGQTRASVDLVFRRDDVGLVARLEVQPQLENGRRPDFRLSFNSGPTVSKPPLAIILDAKFRTRWRRGEMHDVLDDLVRRRSYGEEARRVFILQPATRTIEETSSPLSWGHDCDYGHDAPCNHRQGSIRLSPGEDAKQNLQRLVAMELQASFPKPIQRTDEKWESRSFCIACGCRHEPADVRNRSLKGGDAWTLTCHECGFTTDRTHCFECKMPLFKNGLHLTYHRTIADQLTNVVCPSCAARFDVVQGVGT